jgi:TRAP transporter TAXI family solute receptor
MVAPMNAGPIFFIARADGPIRTVADLRGRRVATGTESGGMTQHVRAILGALGMSMADIEPVYLDFAAGADALAAGEVDAQFQCPIPNRVMTDLGRRIAVRVLPYGPGQLDTVLKAAPAYRRTIMRKGAIRGLDADVAQVAVVNVLATHARLDDARVHALTQSVIAGADELARLNPLFAGLADLFVPLRREGAKAFEFGGVPLHPGALQAYRGAGLLKQG